MNLSKRTLIVVISLMVFAAGAFIYSRSQQKELKVTPPQSLEVEASTEVPLTPISTPAPTPTPTPMPTLTPRPNSALPAKPELPKRRVSQQEPSRTEKQERDSKPSMVSETKTESSKTTEPESAEPMTSEIMESIPSPHFSPSTLPQETASVHEVPTPQEAPTSQEASTSQKNLNSEVEPRSLWVALGAGFSFSSLTQDIPGLSSLNVGEFKAPFLIVELGAWLKKNLGLDLSYQSLPGKILSSQSLAITPNSYQWQTFSAEGLYRLGDGLLGAESEWILSFGLQQHSLPYLVMQNSSQLALIHNNLTMASVGFKYLFPIQQKTRFEWKMHYLLPVAASSVAGASFSAQSKLAFDGSLGALYQINKNMSVGAYWSGQYLSHRFKYSDTSGAAPVVGDQSLLQSNMSLRLRWEF